MSSVAAFASCLAQSLDDSYLLAGARVLALQLKILCCGEWRAATFFHFLPD